MNSKMVKEIVSLYADNIPAREIARRLGLSVQTILYHLRRNNIKIKSSADICKALNTKQEQEVINKYASGISQNKLSKEHDVSIYTIYKTLNKYDVTRRGVRESVGYRPLKMPRPPTMMFFYYLGLMLSDGWVCERKYSKIAGLGMTDKVILEHLINTISPGRRIYVDNKKHKSILGSRAIRSKKIFYRILLPINADYMELLADWGCIKRKSLRIKPTNNLLNMSDRQFHQMLVGLIEGDGSIWYTKHKAIVLYTTRKFGQFIIDRVGFGHLNKSRTIWACRWQGKEARRLARILLRCDKLILNRKWDKARDFDASINNN